MNALLKVRQLAVRGVSGVRAKRSNFGVLVQAFVTAV